jgi:hypothetical protein
MKEGEYHLPVAPGNRRSKAGCLSKTLASVKRYCIIFKAVEPLNPFVLALVRTVKSSAKTCEVLKRRSPQRGHFKKTSS